MALLRLETKAPIQFFSFDLIINSTKIV